MRGRQGEPFLRRQGAVEEFGHHQQQFVLADGVVLVAAAGDDPRIQNVDPGPVPGPVEPDPGHPFPGGFDDPGDRVVLGVPVPVPFPVEAADLPSRVDRVLDVVVLHIGAFGDADIADEDDVDRLHHVPVVQHERVRPDIHAGLFVDPGRAAAERRLGPDQGRVGGHHLPGRGDRGVPVDHLIPAEPVQEPVPPQTPRGRTLQVVPLPPVGDVIVVARRLVLICFLDVGVGAEQGRGRALPPPGRLFRAFLPSRLPTTLLVEAATFTPVRRRIIRLGVGRWCVVRADVPWSVSGMVIGSVLVPSAVTAPSRRPAGRRTRRSRRRSGRPSPSRPGHGPAAGPGGRVRSR